jgi:hypothetical protein
LTKQKLFVSLRTLRKTLRPLRLKKDKEIIDEETIDEEKKIKKHEFPK